MLNLYLEKTKNYFSHLEMMENTFSVPESYPNIFDENLDKDGRIINENDTIPFYEMTKSFSVSSQFEISNRLENFITTLAKDLKKLKEKKRSLIDKSFPNYSREDWDSKIENLFYLSDSYQQ